MTTKETIELLSQEVAKLREEIEAMRAAGGYVHVHHHYPPAASPVPAPWPPLPTITYSGGESRGYPGEVTVWN